MLDIEEAGQGGADQNANPPAAQRRFANPFQNDQYERFTGFPLRQSFNGIDRVPALKGATLKPDVIKKMMTKKAEKNRDKFTKEPENFGDTEYFKPQVNLEFAIKEVSYLIRTMVGGDVKMHKDGYIGYKVIDAKDNIYYSTNLQRIRKAIRLRTQAPEVIGKGPMIQMDVPDTVGYAQAIATNRCWGVVISWHKLLRSSLAYDDKYRSKTLDENFTVLQRKKQANLTRRIYTLSIGNNLNEYAQKIQNGVERNNKRAKDKLDFITDLVGRARGQLPEKYRRVNDPNYRVSE